MLEASAADHLYGRDDLAGEDEGRLSTRRARLLDGGHLLRAAAELGWLPECRRHPSHLLDHVQARVGLTARVHGLSAGLLAASQLW